MGVHFQWFYGKGILGMKREGSPEEPTSSPPISIMSLESETKTNAQGFFNDLVL